MKSFSLEEIFQIYSTEFQRHGKYPKWIQYVIYCSDTNTEFTISRQMPDHPYFQSGIKAHDKLAKTNTSFFSEFNFTGNRDWVWFLRTKISISIRSSWKLDDNRLCHIQPKTTQLEIC